MKQSKYYDHGFQMSAEAPHALHKQHDLFLNLTHIKVHVSSVSIAEMSKLHYMYRTMSGSSTSNE